MSDELVSVPTDLKLLSDDELTQLEARATGEFDRLNEADDVTPEALESLLSLTDGIERLRAEIALRNDRAQKEADLAKAKLADQKSALQARIHGQQAPAPVTPDGEPVADNAESIAAAAARGVTAALVTMLGDRRPGNDLTELSRRATSSLADARRFAPVVPVPKQQLAVTAAVDIPGLARNDDLNNLDSLANAFHRRARGMTVTHGQPNEQLVATIRNEYEHTVDDRTTPSQVDDLFRHLTSRDKQNALVAGGGWCAPSEIRYDFFNIACEDGTIDLPTVGISRGGIRFPSSPSIADAFTNTGGITGLAPFGSTAGGFTNATVPWLWTETDDALTVTGSINKPTLRVPCPTFNERRLECYGITLTAGNLTDDAYPEATQNFLRLMMSAHEHAQNARIIATMAALSTAAVTGGAYAAAGPVFNNVLGGVSLAATDYRARYGMCADDVLEVVIPQWILGAIQADIAHRVGEFEFLSVTKAQIIQYFADRNVRPQFVNDWQVRGASQFGAAASMTAWPQNVTFMIYAAGTFILGNGLSLDLGVVRDSVLNAENDFTAAWSEECHLVAMVGHESRQYTVVFDVAGDICCDAALASTVTGTGIL
jgi:hypothetical protein